MQSLNSDMNAKKHERLLVGPVGRGSKMLLPKPLRRMVRFFVNVTCEKIALPRFIGTMSLVGFYAVVGLYGIIAGGCVVKVGQNISAAFGLSVEKVQISGDHKTAESDILRQMDLPSVISLVSLDVAALRKRLVKLPWVQEADVRKKYPDTLDVKLQERKAFGIWQQDHSLLLIEKDGHVIEPLGHNSDTGLPLLVGDGANVAADKLMTVMHAFPDLKARVSAFVRVADRRWDLHLKNGVIVKLPQKNVDAALEGLRQLEQKNKLLERQIVCVDLRIKKRWTIRLTPEAALERHAKVKNEMKQLKKSELLEWQI